jgi:hypothetical protein
MVYTIEQLTLEDLKKQDVIVYLIMVVPKIGKLFEDKFDWRNADVEYLVKNRIFLICRRDGKISGHLICNLFNSPLDPKVTILQQTLFYVKPDSGRTAYHLFQKFIDIGKDRANHIITMLTTHTNIKPITLENMGFKELETMYRMEIK